jgi:hypothetical protein
VPSHTKPIRQGMLRACLVLVSVVSSLTAHAQSAPLLDDVHTIVGATYGPPAEHTFPIATAGTYTLTLKDLGATFTPSAPLASVQFSVTHGPSLVGTPQTAAGSLTFSATPGNYTVHILGKPGTDANGILPDSGAILTTVTDSANTQVATFTDQLSLPQQLLPDGQDTFQDSFTVSTQGSYTIKLTDLQLPAALKIGGALLSAQTTGSFLATLVTGGMLQQTLTLQPGTQYVLIGTGQANATGGLYNVTVRAADGTVVYSKTRSIGGVTDLGQAPLRAGSSHTLSFSDLAFPKALAPSGNGAVVVLNDVVAAQLTASGASQTFTAAAGGNYEVFSIATPDTTAGVGTYSVQVVSQSGEAILSTARAVTVPGNAQTAYSFDTTIPTAGTYSATLHDFSFPVALTSVTFAAAQNGALVGGLQKGSGSINISPSAGPITFLAVAQPNSQVSGGLFDINLASAGSNTVLFDATQGVGASFVSRKITVTADTAGSYDVTASDVGFPANFASYEVEVTQGTQSFGTITNHGQVSFTAKPGDYFINFLAQPSSTADAGTYALNVTYSAPTVTLGSNPTHVAHGGVATLTWTSTNATSCTASGGWSGTQQPNGTAQSSALNSDTTFTLTCTGPNGQGSGSVSVTADPATGGKGGGGELDSLVILALAAGLGIRSRRGRSAPLQH